MRVHLRTRQLKPGKGKPDIGLVLDYTPPRTMPDGTTSRWESLRLYIYSKPRDPHERQHNRDVKALAESIRNQREEAVRNDEYDPMREDKKTTLAEYLEQQASVRKPQTARQWSFMIRQLRIAGLANVKLSQLDVRACNRFRDYLLKLKNTGKLGDHTACNYMRYFRTGLRQAYRSRIIHDNLLERFDALPEGRSKREFLTMEELQRLAATPIKNDVTRRVSLFSALTGLRISDIRALQWIHVIDRDGQSSLDYRQVKTGKHVIKPINSQARELLGKRDKGLVFPWIPEQSTISETVKTWVRRAGINKPRFSFHGFRHTFATLQLASGTDIMTVSDLLDHSNVRTTQVYAKVLDDAKRAAVERVTLVL